MVGQFVLSTAGRDKGRVHVVSAAAECEYLFIADGKTRKIDKPKKKKLKHIKLLEYKDEGLAEDIMSGKATDLQVANALAQFQLREMQTDL